MVLAKTTILTVFKRQKNYVWENAWVTEPIGIELVLIFANQFAQI